MLGDGATCFLRVGGVGRWWFKVDNKIKYFLVNFNISELENQAEDPMGADVTPLRQRQVRSPDEQGD